MNIKKLNPAGAFKKERGKRNLGEKYDSKFYLNNYKKDVLYMNYEDLLDNLYMENKGIDYQLRSSKKFNINKKNNESNNFNYDNYSIDKNDNNLIHNSNNINTNNIINKNRNNEKNGDKEDEIIINKNNNSEITFKQNKNNININIDDKENNNKNILRGKPNKLKENKILIKNNISKNENENKYLNNNYQNYKNNLNRFNDNNDSPEEEIENINKNEYIGDDKNKENNDYEKTAINNENNTNNVNKSEDIRLNFVMKKLGLESLIYVFENYHMSFNDVLFLTKEDLNELGFKIFQKNRLISFIEEYTSKAKNYTLEEIQAFFEENSIYNLSGKQEYN